MVSRIQGVILAAVLVMPVTVVQADDMATLKAQVDALSERVSELEKKIGIVDTPAVQRAIQEVVGPVNPGDSGDKTNWDLLKVGLSYNEVRELLGEPVSIKKGGMEFWYYSDKKLDGPFVKFLFRKANDWKSPKSE